MRQNYYYDEYYYYHRHHHYYYQYLIIPLYAFFMPSYKRVFYERPNFSSVKFCPTLSSVMPVLGDEHEATLGASQMFSLQSAVKEGED